MKLRVTHSRSGLLLTGFHTISSVSHYIEKTINILFLAPLFVAGLVFPLYEISRIVFFHEPVYNGDYGDAIPRWAVLAFVVPFLAVFSLGWGFGTWLALMQTIQMTRDRPDWEVTLSESKWCITLHHKNTHPDDAIERRELKPSHIEKIETDRGGRVYAHVVTGSNGKDEPTRVDLTMALLPNEAVWVEQALGSLLTLAPGFL